MNSASRSSLAQALFEPRAIALVGASADLAKNNSRPQRFLKQHGYSGRVIPVNPGRSEILGEKAYPDLRAVPEAIDHAFIMVPAAAVPGVIAQCCERKVSVATMFSAGFAELGEEGLARQREMVQTARAGGLRLLGPNCMGIINVHRAMPLTVNAVLGQERLKPGPLSVISQSGSTLGTLLSRAQARGLGFSKLFRSAMNAIWASGKSRTCSWTIPTPARYCCSSRPSATRITWRGQHAARWRWASP